MSSGFIHNEAKFSENGTFGMHTLDKHLLRDRPGYNHQIIHESILKICMILGMIYLVTTYLISV